MAVSEVTKRFLECLDLLITTGQVRSKRQFAISVGYHAQGLSEMTAARREVPLDVISRSVLEYKLNPVFLFTGKGKPQLSHFEEDGLAIRSLTTVTDEQGEERIVHVPFPAQAGYGSLCADPVFIQELPTFQLPDPQFRSGTYRSFEISGTSMEPAFQSGDCVIAAYIEPRFWEQAIRHHHAYVIVTQEDVFIKRIRNLIRNEKQIECLSDNPSFDPFRIHVQDLREIWKVRLRMTTQLDAAATATTSNDISAQLQVHQQILESLQKQMTRYRVS